MGEELTIVTIVLAIVNMVAAIARLLSADCLAFDPHLLNKSPHRRAGRQIYRQGRARDGFVGLVICHRTKLPGVWSKAESITSNLL
jgi:hypothetical protein